MKSRKDEMARLPSDQQELLDAMRTGVYCRYVPSAYYVRSDSGKQCTNAANALLRKGLVAVTDTHCARHKLVALPE